MELLSKKEILKPKEVAEYLGVSVKTLQSWDIKKILCSHRTLTGRRYYLPEEISKFSKDYFGE